MPGTPHLPGREYRRGQTGVGEWPWNEGDVSPPQPLLASSLQVFYIAGNAKSQSHLCSVCHVPPHFPSLYSFPEDPQGTRGMP